MLGCAWSKKSHNLLVDINWYLSLRKQFFSIDAWIWSMMWAPDATGGVSIAAKASVLGEMAATVDLRFPKIR